jgi:hypothetical protein
MRIIAILVPFAVAIVGLLLYVLPGKPERKEVGRQLLFCGLFWTIAVFAWREIKF